MDETLDPRPRLTDRMPRWMVLGANVATVFALLYGGSAIQSSVPLYEGTNTAVTVTAHTLHSFAQPIIDKVKEH